MMPTELRRVVADSFVPVTPSFGSEIVKEGDPAEAFFVIASGRAPATKARPGGQELPLTIPRPAAGARDQARPGGARAPPPHPARGRQLRRDGPARRTPPHRHRAREQRR